MLFILTPLAGLSVCVVAHILLARLAAGGARLGIAIGSFLLGLGVTAMLTLLYVRQTGTAGLANQIGYLGTWLLAYLCLAHNYLLGFYNLSESARRIRLLIELYLAGARGLSLEELRRVYNADMIVQARLSRLLAGGQIVDRDGRLHVGRPLVLYSARVFGLLKLVFLGSRSEFGQDRRVGFAARIPGGSTPIQ